MKEWLLRVIRERAVTKGNFKLSSGKESNLYIDSKKVLFNTDFSSLLGRLIYNKINHLDVQAIGGMEVGAIPMSFAIFSAYNRAGKYLEGFFVRKNKKEYGSQSKIEGYLQPDWNVVVVDDVITTGKSTLEAIKVVEEYGGVVKAVVCLVDRQEGADKLIPYPIISMFTAEEILADL